MVWRGDGRELYSGDRPDLKVMAVDVATSPNTADGRTEECCFTCPATRRAIRHDENISWDGERFVFVSAGRGGGRHRAVGP